MGARYRTFWLSGASACTHQPAPPCSLTLGATRKPGSFYVIFYCFMFSAHGLQNDCPLPCSVTRMRLLGSFKLFAMLFHFFFFFFFTVSRWLSLKMDDQNQQKHFWGVLLAIRAVTARDVWDLEDQNAFIPASPSTLPWTAQSLELRPGAVIAACLCCPLAKCPILVLWSIILPLPTSCVSGLLTHVKSCSPSRQCPDCQGFWLYWTRLQSPNSTDPLYPLSSPPCSFPALRVLPVLINFADEHF